MWAWQWLYRLSMSIPPSASSSPYRVMHSKASIVHVPSSQKMSPIDTVCTLAAPTTNVARTRSWRGLAGAETVRSRWLRALQGAGTLARV